ncbi:biotin transporter BioY [Tessaracoccus sp. G1721]
MSTTTAPAVRSFAPADLAYVAVFAALIAALALTPAIPIGTLGVPITLQTLGVALAGLCLGAWRGAAAVALYLLVGLAGLPVFSGGRAGLAVLVGPTGGYLIGFLFSAFVVGLVAQWAVRRGLSPLTPVLFFLGVFAARVLIIWPLGVAGIARAVGKPIGEIWLSDLAFWPGDILKGIIAAVIAFAVHKAFPRLLGR